MRGKWTSGALALFVICGAGIAQDRFDKQITRARLLYTRGELMQAEKSLRGVVQDGSDAQREQARVLLAQLHGKALVAAKPAGGAAAAKQDPQGSGDDPIYALIRVLNSGIEGDKVRTARNELRSLGGLVVQHLVDTFPKLGPFGVQNVLELLRYQDDPRVLAMLQHQVENGRPEVVASIAQSLTKLHRSVARPLAQRFAEAGQPDEYRLAALGVMLKDAPESAGCRQLEAALLASDDADVRGDALAIVVERGRIEQDAAVRILKGLPASQQAWRPLYWSNSHKDWLEAAKIGARAAMQDDSYAKSLRQYIEEFEWWRGDDEGMELMLTMAERTDNHAESGRVVLYKAVERGWTVPASMEDRVCDLIGRINQSQLYTLVKGLPVDGEARAIGLWERHPACRKELLNAVVGLARPWHRLAAKHLLSIENAMEIDHGIVGRDWSGAPKDAIADLKRFAAKWPTMPSGVSSQWMVSLARAYKDYSEIGIDVVEAHLRSGEERVWQIVERHDPRGTLELVKGFPEIDRFQGEHSAALLEGHGRAEDMALALKLVELPLEQHAWNSLFSYLARFGGGSLPLLQRVARPDGLPQEGLRFLPRLAEIGTRDADIGQIRGFLAVMPDLHADAMMNIWRSFNDELGPEHVDALGDALQALIAAGWKVRGADRDGNRAGMLSRGLVGMLKRTGSPRASAPLRAVVADPAATDLCVRSAVAALTEVAGKDRKAIVAELLRHERPAVAIAALDDASIAADRELQDLALAAVLANAATSDLVANVFTDLQREDRVRFANAVVRHEGMRSFRREVMRVALESYAGSKDLTYLKQMIRASMHEDEDVRSQAAMLLGKTFTREAVTPLLNMLRDDEEKVRLTAQKGLDMIANYLEEREKWEKRFGGK